MQSLSLTVPLGGAVNRQALAGACRELAASLARELRLKVLVYRELSLEADTDAGPVNIVNVFTGHRAPSALDLNLQKMVSRLRVTTPVESLTVTVTGLARAPVAQTTLFGGKDPLREVRLRRVLDAVNRRHTLIPASSLGTTRREKMLCFYDPLRQEENPLEIAGGKN
ncbi:MAG: hypothetical protein C4570_04360 [Ammonifex sp.]|jgi:hypothetical protein|nr:MAG: hypothetical protein C4570_04360 [Ammonifex sp.]